MHLKLFHAESRTAMTAGNIIHKELDLPPFNIEQLEQTYYQGKKNLAMGFRDFCVKWSEDWHTLPKPEAAVVEWSKEELTVGYIPMFEEADVKDNLIAKSSRGFSFVWTIGSALEEEAAREVTNSALQGMFLDTAGSLLLAAIRRRIQEYVTEILKVDETMLCEHIPELREGDNQVLTVCAPWNCVSKTDKPAFSVNRFGVIHPLKSQCAMYFACQAADEPLELFTRPCSQCKGSKCLYLQFGGCHLPKRLQPSPHRR